jgi:hypothetical protein
MTELAARPAALARGVRLEAFTVAWMAIESAVAIGAGVAWNASDLHHYPARWRRA